MNFVVTIFLIFFSLFRLYMKRSFLAVVLFVAFASCSWQIVDSDFATIAIATSFWESTTGYVAGGTASVQPLFL